MTRCPPRSDLFELPIPLGLFTRGCQEPVARPAEFKWHDKHRFWMPVGHDSTPCATQKCGVVYEMQTLEHFRARGRPLEVRPTCGHAVVLQPPSAAVAGPQNKYQLWTSSGGLHMGIMWAGGGTTMRRELTLTSRTGPSACATCGVQVKWWAEFADVLAALIAGSVCPSRPF